jgi:RNA polymerase sigma-70 factor (ECF subfamily)
VQSFPVIFGKSKTSSIAVLDVLRPSRAKSSPDTRPAEDTAHAPTDEKLIADVAKQDSGALAHLLDRYSRLVMRIAARILHDYGEAEEIAQEVFLYVYQKAATFDASKGTGRGWIIQLAYHRAFDRRAYLNRRSFYVGTDVASMTDTLLGDTDLDREIASRLSRVQLEKAFEELPERQRRTLELFYFEGLELREISEKLGEPLSNVRHHYYRALKKLQKSAIVQKLRDPEK